MGRLLLLTTLAGAVSLAYAGVAAAGCAATVGLAPPPAGIEPGQTWTARITVLQHGVRPLPDHETARPTLTIVSAGNGARREFVARPTKDPAVFEAAVVFPAAGSWRYEVFDGFTSYEGEPVPCAQTHTFAAVTVGAAPPAPPAREPAPAPAAPVAAATGEERPLWPFAVGVPLALAALSAGALAWRRRAHTPEAAAP
jgi:LPXTG-motif cell wall-anchored protein